MICPYCKATNIEGVDLCDSCGESLMHVVPASVKAESRHSVAQDTLAVVEAAEVVMVAPTTTVAEVVDRLASANVSCVLVVGADGALRGIFSERDLLYKVAAQYDKLKSSPIHEFMTPDPEALPPDATVAWALNRMDVGGFRHIPIVQDGHPVGLVSVRDLLAHLAGEYLMVAQ